MTQFVYNGGALRAIRTESGLNQGEVCGRTGIVQGTLSNYELGKSVPTVENALRLARAYGFTIDEFLDRLWDEVEVSDVVA